MNIQFKKGVLELCVLSQLVKGDRYGYDLASDLARTIEIADGTIYPVLRRLKSDGCLSEGIVGRPAPEILPAHTGRRQIPQRASC